jgi:hypothetical protein
MATKKGFKVHYDGESYEVKAYSPKQAKLMAYMKHIKGKGYTFKEVNAHRGSFTKLAKVA